VNFELRLLLLSFQICHKTALFVADTLRHIRHNNLQKIRVLATTYFGVRAFKYKRNNEREHSKRTASEFFGLAAVINGGGRAEIVVIKAFSHDDAPSYPLSSS
jgi:hypothetical protein